MVALSVQKLTAPPICPPSFKPTITDNFILTLENTVCMDIITWKPIHVDSLSAEANTHVTISSLANYFHFKVIKSTSSWDGMRGSDTGSIFVCFTMT